MAQQLVKVSDIGKMFTDYSDELAALAPTGMDSQRFQIGVIQCFRKNADLQKCSPLSIKVAIMEAMAAGVIPGGMPPMGFFIPYKGECTWQTSWQGVVYQMRKYGGLLNLEVIPVFNGDHFRLFRTPEGLQFEYELRTDTESYEELRGVMVEGEFKGGIKSRLWVRKDTIARCRSKSMAPNAAWKTDTFGMYTKTAILQYSKDKPRTPDLEAIFQKEMRREYGASWSSHPEFEAPVAVAAANIKQIEESVEDHTGGEPLTMEAQVAN
jgi:recombination protein RecT